MNLIKKLLLSILIIVILIIIYPFILDKMIIFYNHSNSQIQSINKKQSIDLTAERGTFGDMYGLLNTFFSGVALVGLFVTYFIEKEKVRNERKQQQKDRLSYLGKILHDTIKTIDQVLASHLYFTEELELIESEIFNFGYESNQEVISRLGSRVSRFNEEDHFVAYLECIKLPTEGIYIGTFNITRLLDTLMDTPRVLSEIESEHQKVINEIHRLNKAMRHSIHSIVMMSRNNKEILESQNYQNWYNSKKYLYDNLIIFNSLIIKINELNVKNIDPNIYSEIFEFESNHRFLKEFLMEYINKNRKKIFYLESDRELFVSEFDKLVKFIKS